MKKLLKILLLILLFSSPGLMAQFIEGENGWWQFPRENIDPSTRNYLTHQGSQIFENIGTSKFSSDSSENIFQVTWFKDFLKPQIDFPDSFVFRYKVLEESGGLSKKCLALFLQDSTGRWLTLNLVGDLIGYSWKLIKIPIKEIFERNGVPIMEKILTVYMVFWMTSYDPFGEVGLTVEMDYFSGIYPDGSEIVYDDFDDVTSVQEEEVITNYILEQNYPNPFNPTTKIKYQLPQESYVSIKLYDILGREIKVLTATQHAAGNYELNFDGSNLPSGTYIYRITAGSFTESKKMLLVK